MRATFLSKSSRSSLIATTTLTAIVSILSFAPATYASIYAPGQTLDPDCAPGSASCGVEVPLTTTAIQNNVSDGLQVTGGGGLAVQLDGSATPWGVNYNRIVVLAVKAIQDQQAIINGIKTDTNAIKNGMATTLTLNSLTVNGGLSVKGDTDFAGKVKFTGQVSFNSDTAGTATIHSGDSEVRVVFKQQLDAIPVVNATPLGIVSSKYGVKDVTQQGFTIVIDPTQLTDAIFNWMAIQPNTTQ